jgi:hypothetical protein
MLLQFKGREETPEGFIPDMVFNAKFATPFVFALFIAIYVISALVLA